MRYIVAVAMQVLILQRYTRGEGHTKKPENTCAK